tara:strand:+ start:254 stop:856 length:603 start_codon:yes stop_codon:yes gene_type:complete
MKNFKTDELKSVTGFGSSWLFFIMFVVVAIISSSSSIALSDRCSDDVTENDLDQAKNLGISAIIFIVISVALLAVCSWTSGKWNNPVEIINSCVNGDKKNPVLGIFTCISIMLVLGLSVSANFIGIDSYKNCASVVTDSTVNEQEGYMSAVNTLKRTESLMYLIIVIIALSVIGKIVLDSNGNSFGKYTKKMKKNLFRIR